jgi:hypothetical protein
MTDDTQRAPDPTTADTPEDENADDVDKSPEPENDEVEDKEPKQP